ncbi:MAG: hypothetical protein M5U34_14390 [Chloroflexi bacterium]|nr:hypothetical protein [Chloroflexota bacterium]
MDVGLASVTGLYDNPAGGNYQVLFYNLNLDPGLASPIGITTMMEETGGVHACPGIGNTTLTFTSANIGHTIRVVHPDGSFCGHHRARGSRYPHSHPHPNRHCHRGANGNRHRHRHQYTDRPFISVLPRTCARGPECGNFRDRR